MQACDLFELPSTLPFTDFFKADAAPWEWLPKINEALASFDFSNHQGHSEIPAGVHVTGDVFIHPTVKLPPYAVIEGPTYIGANTEIRPGAYIRGKVIIGEGCVLGNACEYKNCLLMDQVQTPHYNYVGDSILGTGAHLGAGVILANLRLDQKEVAVKTEKGRIDTGLRKLGALMGEGAEVGCNAVLQPGTILGKKSIVFPTLAFSGTLSKNTQAYASQQMQTMPRG
tara:strand:+ start:7018 stop:7698 length:681 start_codon:yes stop_codon:yes gene_type:complete